MEEWTLMFTDRESETLNVMLQNVSKEEAYKEANALLQLHIPPSFVSVVSKEGECVAGFRSTLNSGNGETKIEREF